MQIKIFLKKTESHFIAPVSLSETNEIHCPCSESFRKIGIYKKILKKPEMWFRSSVSLSERKQNYGKGEGSYDAESTVVIPFRYRKQNDMKK